MRCEERSEKSEERREKREERREKREKRETREKRREEKRREERRTHTAEGPSSSLRTATLRPARPHATSGCGRALHPKGEATEKEEAHLQDHHDLRLEEELHADGCQAC